MSEKNLFAKILTITKKIEIKSSIDGAGLHTQVRDKPTIVSSRGPNEIERLELPRPTVVSKEGITVRAVEKSKEIVRMVNHGPVGPRGEQGLPGDKGEPGSIDNFVMDDLVAIFRSRLTYD